MVVFRVSATGNEIGGPASSATDGFEFRSRFFPRFFFSHENCINFNFLKILSFVIEMSRGR